MANRALVQAINLARIQQMEAHYRKSILGKGQK